MALRQESFSDWGVRGVELVRLAADFRRALLRQDRAEATIRSYEFGWRSFLRFLEHHGVTETGQLTRDLIEAWQDGLRLKPRSKALASTAVRRFLTFAVERDFLEFKLVLAVAQVRVHPGLPRPLPPDDLERIAIYLGRPRVLSTVIGLRNRALFWYLVTTGARVSEALQVTRSDISQAYVVQKGGTEKLLLCPPSVVAMIREYLAVRDDNSRWLWVTHTSNLLPDRMGPKTVREVWKTLAKRARVRQFTTHQLRHTNATELLAADISPSAIAEHLGHHDQRTLMNYAQVDTAHRQKVVMAMERLVRYGGRRLP